MPTAKTDDVINRFIMDIYDGGRKIGGLENEFGTGGHIMYDHSRVVPGALKRLDEAGCEIVRKGERAKPAVAPVMGNVAVLTPEGERIVKAITAGDFTGISDRDFTAFQGIRGKVVQASEVADQAVRVTELMAGIIIKAPKGKVAYPHVGDLFDPPAIDPRAKAVQDCIEASRLTYAAARVLGHDAVSEILNSFEPSEHDADEGEAA